MPTFWDTLKSVGVQAASTAGAVYQSSLGVFSGVANSKINQVANGIQSQVGNIAKPATSQPANANPQPAAPPATPAKTFSISLVGLIIAGLAIIFLMRKK